MLSKQLKIKTKTDLKRSIDQLPSNAKIDVHEITDATTKKQLIDLINRLTRQSNLSVVLIEN